MDLNYNDYEHSSYKYGEAPQVLGITGALKKIIEHHPYSLIDNIPRQKSSSKPYTGLPIVGHRVGFSRDNSQLMIVNVLLFSKENTSLNPVITGMEINHEGTIYNSYISEFWEENGKFFELHMIPIGNTISEDELMTVSIDARYSITSNILIYSSSYMYDLIGFSNDFIEPERYMSVSVENFLLQSIFINIRSKKYGITQLGGYDRHWIPSKEDNIVFAWLETGVNLNSGDYVVWNFISSHSTMATDYGGSGIPSVITITTPANVILCELPKYDFRHLINVELVEYHIYDSSNNLVSEGYAYHREYIKIYSSKYSNSTIIRNPEQHVDNYTMNAIIDTSSKIPNQYNIHYIDDFFPTILFNVNNSNFNFNNAPSLMGFKKYKWFLSDI